MTIYDYTDQLIRKSAGTPLHGDLLELQAMLVKPAWHARQELTERSILAAVERVFSVSLERMLGHSMKHEVVLARQVAMYCIREYTQASYPRAATALDRYHHKSSMIAHRRIAKMRECDAEFSSAIEAMMAEVRVAA